MWGVAPPASLTCETPPETGAGPPRDVHQLGDALMRAGLTEPVLDVDRFEDDSEVIYGAAWGAAGAPASTSDEGFEIRIPLGSISRRGRP